LPFQALEIWTQFQMQQKTYHDSKHVLPAQTLNACPPSEAWPLGRFDTAIANMSRDITWPERTLRGAVLVLIQLFEAYQPIGHCVVQVRLVMHPVLPAGFSRFAGLDQFLTYVQRFDIVPQPGSITDQHDRVTQMFVLKRSLRSDRSRLGDIVPLSQLRAPVDVVPRFSGPADNRLSKVNTLEYSSEFLLNKYFDKDTFYSLELE
jgi:hypothetical protein